MYGCFSGFRIEKSVKTRNPEKCHVTYQIKALFKLVDVDHTKIRISGFWIRKIRKTGKNGKKIILHLYYIAESHAADRPLPGEWVIIAGSLVNFITNLFILTNNLVKLNAYIVIFHSPWVKLTNNLLIHPNNLLKSVTYVAILTVHQRGLVKFTKNMFNTTTNKYMSKL